MRFRKEKTDDKIICLESLVIKKNKKKKTHCLRYSIRVFKSNFNKCILSWNSPNLTPPTATTICTSAVHTLPEPGEPLGPLISDLLTSCLFLLSLQRLSLMTSFSRTRSSWQLTTCARRCWGNILLWLQDAVSASSQTDVLRWELTAFLHLLKPSVECGCVKY